MKTNLTKINADDFDLSNVKSISDICRKSSIGYADFDMSNVPLLQIQEGVKI